MPADRLDDVALVHGHRAQLALEAAAAQLGGRLARARLRSVDHRPGAGVTAVHDVSVTDATGDVSEHVLALTTDVDAVAGRPGTLVLAADDVRLGVWLLPHDPALPGLVPALDRGAVAQLLTRCGVPTSADDVALSVRAYRPRRRAVVEVGAGAASLFLKVVPPEEVRTLHERHRLLVRAGVPAPRSLGMDPRGVVVLARLPGRTWRQAMHAGAPSPSAAALWAAMDRLPAELLERPVRPSWSEQSWHHVALLEAALPEHATRVRSLAAAADVQERVAATATVPVHGDLYEAQVMVGGDGAVSGLLDLDTAGPGHRVDDEACLAAHLALLPLARPAVSAACASAWHDHLLHAADPDLLWRRSCLVLLTLATGPTRSRREGWEDVTSRWLRLPELLLDAVDDRPWERGPSALLRLVDAARRHRAAMSAVSSS